MRRKRLPDSELEVMLLIWQSENSIPTGDILAKICAKKPGEKCTLQTVQSTLNRLVEKGFACCEKIGRLNFYTPAVDAEEYRRQEASSFVERLYDNSPSKLFASLIQDGAVSREELKQLRKMLEEGGEEL